MLTLLIALSLGGGPAFSCGSVAEYVRASPPAKPQLRAAAELADQIVAWVGDPDPELLALAFDAGWSSAESQARLERTGLGTTLRERETIFRETALVTATLSRDPEATPLAVAERAMRGIEADSSQLEDGRVAGPVWTSSHRPPVAVLLDRILGDLGAAWLAQVAVGQTRVLARLGEWPASNRPGLEHALRHYLEAEEHVARLVTDEWIARQRAIAQAAALRDAARMRGGAGEVVLTIQSLESEIVAQLTVYTEEGQARALAARRLSMGSTPRDLPSRLVPLTPEEVRYLDAFRPLPPGMQLSAQGRPAPDAWQWERLLAPEKHEPLRLAAGAILRDVARRHPGPLVARLPDALFELAVDCRRGDSMDVARFEVLAKARGLWTIEPGANGTVVRPALTLRADRSHVDRRALRALMRAAADAGHVPFLAYADFWHAAGDAPAWSLFDESFLAAANARGVALSHIGRHPYPALQFVGSLPPGVRSRAQHGTAAPISGLPSAARNRLDSWLRRPFVAARAREDFADVALTYPRLAQLTSAPGSVLTITRADALRVTRIQPKATREAYTPASLIEEIGSRWRQGLLADASGALAGTWATRRQPITTIRVVLDGFAKLELEAEDPPGPPDHGGPWENLPPAFRDPVERFVRESLPNLPRNAQASARREDP